MSSTAAVRDVDPMLKDMIEKKQNLRRNLVLLAAELKEVRGRLASLEQCFANETLTRQQAESKVKMMLEEIDRLQRSLEERDVQLQASEFVTEMYVKELEDLKLQLSATKAAAEANALSASTKLHFSVFGKELEEKNNFLEDHGIHVKKLGVQIPVLLPNDIRARELAQMQLEDELARMKHEIMQPLANAGPNKDYQLRKILDEMCSEIFDEMDKLLTVKEEEIAKLRDEISFLSLHWKLKTKELESQLEKHRRADQELRERVVKLELCLQEARSQTRMLQRIGQLRDKAIMKLRDALAAMHGIDPPQNFWDSSSFKIAVSVSMLILVIISKRHFLSL